MPFIQMDTTVEIKQKKQNTEEFNRLWNATQEEHRLIGEMIALRKSEKKTQSELAILIGKKQQIISRLEQHQSKPSLRLCCNILDALGYQLKIERKL